MTNVLFTPVVESVSKWAPVVGEFSQRYLGGLSIDHEAKNRVLSESWNILANCTNPSTETYSEAGLVIGYVQSGKTLSFTTIAALARDNGYGMVIVLAGVTNLLRSQSMDRLVDDLGLNSHYGDWQLFDNPGAATINPASDQYVNFRDRLTQWKRWQAGETRFKKPCLLVTVLKHNGRLNNLANLLETFDLTNIPVLVVDDESDQASPNNKSSKNLRSGNDDRSSTYEAIESLRSVIPRHSYLQYTATPQANLLAAKTDALSPAFGRVISAGQDYVGGEDFFIHDQSHIVRIPDDDEIHGANMPIEPPESLQDSLMSFWVGCALAMAEESLHPLLQDGLQNRSMMIHASARTAPHAKFTEWVGAIKGIWKTTLRDPDSLEYSDLVADMRDHFNTMSAMYSTEVTFEDLLEIFPEAIDETRVVSVNSTEEAVKNIKWNESKFWVLVGGLKLDRGFTVKGITTTYMPRSAAENADTLQQRARFFGYHRKYFGLCRVYLAQSSIDAFTSYVRHERALRASILAFQGKPLREWKRHFVMDSTLRNPTRTSVTGQVLRRHSLAEKWLAPKHLSENIDATQENIVLLEKFISEIKKAKPQAENPASWIDKRRGTKHALYENIPIGDIQNFLLSLRVTNVADLDMLVPLFAGIEISSREVNPPTVDVVLINDMDVSTLEGRSGQGGITNIFIGRAPQGVTSDALNYVGDRDIRTKNNTLHLRYIKVDESLDQSGNPVYVPWFAFLANESLTVQILKEVD